jgi:hypothetical protein
MFFADLIGDALNYRPYDIADSLFLEPHA